MKKAAFILAGMALPMTGHSAIITQTSGGSADWTDPAVWDGNPISAADDYVTDLAGGAYLRMSASGGDSTFVGNSLTVTTRALLKTQDATTTLNGDLILDGGWFSFAANGAGPWASTFAASNFNVVSSSTMSLGAFHNDTTIDSILTGAGDLLLYLENAPHVDPDQTITFNGINGFTGAFTVTEKLGVAFGTNYAFSNTFTLQDADSFLIVNSGQTLTFDEGGLVDSNGVVAPGSYSGASLDALGGNFLNNGGTVLVVPEPSVALLGGLGFLGLLRRRRAA